MDSVPHALDYRHRAGIPHAESFAGHTVDERLAGGSAVKSHVAHDDIIAGIEGTAFRGTDNQPAAGKSLAETIVAVAGKGEGQSLWNERAKGLPAAAPTIDNIAVVGQIAAALTGDFRAEQGAEGTVGGGHTKIQPAGLF